MKPSKNIVMLITALLTSALFGMLAYAGASYKKTVEQYTVPEVMLVNQDGKKVRLQDVVNSDKPILLDFIFGTCTTICPVLSAGFTSFQRRLGPASDQVHLISISVDPDNDTPKAMKEYLKRYHAKPGWDFLTGSRSDIEKVQRAFNAYTPDKMSHPPLILLKSRPEAEWVRISGLIGSNDLVAEYQKTVK